MGTYWQRNSSRCEILQEKKYISIIGFSYADQVLSSGFHWKLVWLQLFLFDTTKKSFFEVVQYMKWLCKISWWNLNNDFRRISMEHYHSFAFTCYGWFYGLGNACTSFLIDYEQCLVYQFISNIFLSIPILF